jgi:hypothetical protein
MGEPGASATGGNERRSEYSGRQERDAQASALLALRPLRSRLALSGPHLNLDTNRRTVLQPSK